jgi:hypothetical protein
MAKSLFEIVLSRRLETAAEVVGRWQKRFFEERLCGLDDRQHAGPSTPFTPGVVRPGEGDRLRVAAHAGRSALAFLAR